MKPRTTLEIVKEEAKTGAIVGAGVGLGMGAGITVVKLSKNVVKIPAF